MKFLTPIMEMELEALVPALLFACEDFDRWSKKKGLPEAFVTSVMRAPHVGDAFSYHFVFRAVDLKTKHYSDAQLPIVIAWWEGRLSSEDSDILNEVQPPAGRSGWTGPHLHIELNDHSARDRFLAEVGLPKGATP